MKTTLGIILSASLLLLSACSATETTARTNTLEGKALELIAEVDKLAENEEYIALMSASPELEAIITDIAQGDYSTPKTGFIFENLGESLLDAMLMEQNLSDDVHDLIKGRFVSALPSQINGMSGVSNIAAASMLAHSDSFIYEGLELITSYLYTFENDYCFMVTFVPYDENIVNASVSVVINKDLAQCETKEQVEYFMKNVFGIEKVNVSVVTEEK